MKKTRKIIIRALAIIMAIPIVYLLLGWALPKIPIAAEKTASTKTVDIFLLTNGVHTDIVVPVKHSLMDWSQKIPVENIQNSKGTFPYLAIGWGDKGFYLDTPEWKDLKFSTAFKAAFSLSESAMHCTYYPTMKEDENCIKIPVTEEQYKRLISFIDHQFDKDTLGRNILIPTDAVYGNNDAFYEAKGSYSFLMTCNTWANNALKACGQKAALWTPTDFGIFDHYKKK